MSPHDAMMESLEAIAEADIDIVPRFFAELYARYPAEAANFLNPGHSHGTMANEMLTMLLALADGEGWVPTMMRIQQFTHDSHGIALERYEQTLTTLVDVLRDAAGTRWLPEHDAVWRTQTRRLFGIIAENARSMTGEGGAS
jgi:hemoglobin-like flavoprotein